MSDERIKKYCQLKQLQVLEIDETIQQEKLEEANRALHALSDWDSLLDDEILDDGPFSPLQIIFA